MFDALPKRLKYSLTVASLVSCSPGTVCISAVLIRENSCCARSNSAAPRQVGDVARMDDERRRFRHGVHEIDGARERRRDVGIRFLVEADVRVAQLHEQGTAEPGRALAVGRGSAEIERREYAACEHEERARPAVGETTERPAARGGFERVVRHVRLLEFKVRTEDSARLDFIP